MAEPERFASAADSRQGAAQPQTQGDSPFKFEFLGMDGVCGVREGGTLGVVQREV
jgi:hypothetical protein